MRLIHFLLFSLFGSIFLADAEFFKDFGVGSRLIVSVPDLLAILIAIAVVVCMARNRRVDMPAKYIIIGFFIAAHLFAGAIINSVQPGAVFAGIRVYFKYAPVFLLPMVVVFSDRDIMRYLKFVLVLSVLQLPIAIYQRAVASSFNIATGDVVRGTTTSSGILSILLICVIAVLTAFYVRKQISRLMYGILILVLFLPTTINETKSTLVLLPLALLVPVMLDATRGQWERLRTMIPTALIGATLIGGFAVVYDQRWGDPETSIITFITEGKIFEQLYRAQEPGKGYDTGRIDSIVLALNELADDPVHVAVGLGMSNVATSFSRVLGGEYEEYEDYGVRVTNISYLLWETGVIGVLLVMIFLYLLFKDAQSLKYRSDFTGTLALAWCAVIVIIGVSMFYKTLLDQKVISYLFWFFSGYMVAENMRWRMAMTREAQSDNGYVDKSPLVTSKSPHNVLPRSGSPLLGPDQ